VVDRREKSAAQQVSELAGIDSIVFVARFQERVLSRIADHHLGDVWLQQVVQPGRAGAFLNVPRTPRIKSRMVAALASITESITTLPPESITATKMVA